MMGGAGGLGGGGGGGLNRGAGPGVLANVADEDGAAYNQRLARRALAYLAPFRRDVALVMLLTVAQAALMTVGPVLTKVAIDNHIAPPNTDIAGASLLLGLTIIAYFAAF